MLNMMVTIPQVSEKQQLEKPLLVVTLVFNDK